MKKTTLLLLLACLMQAVCIAMPLESYHEEESVVHIVKSDENEQQNNNPRTAFHPIYCTYLKGTFHFSFLEIFEDVTIRIENRSTGEQWYEFLDFTDSSTEIRTSSSAGTYVISIFTDDGYYSGILQK